MNTQIKAEDLRIGNYLDRNGLMQVTAIHKAKIKIYDHFNKMQHEYFFMADTFNGLPITEELLLKAGFERAFTHSVYPKYVHPDGLHQIAPREDGVFVYRVPGVSLVDIRYIHQLQNLYFALTGKELTL